MDKYFFQLTLSYCHFILGVSTVNSPKLFPPLYLPFVRWSFLDILSVSMCRSYTFCISILLVITLNTLFSLCPHLMCRSFPYFFCIFLNVYLFKREREHVCKQEGEGQSEREREPQAGSMLSAEPNTGLDAGRVPEPRDHTRPEPKPRVGCATG